MDQSNRYADLNLREKDLIAGGRHVLVAYIMKPKAGYGGYLETAAHFAAESSTASLLPAPTSRCRPRMTLRAVWMPSSTKLTKKRRS